MKQIDISSATQTVILDAAGKIVLENGADALTLDAVAHSAGISKGGLLYHFPSKKSLIEGMIRRLIKRMDASIEEERSKNSGDDLNAFILAFFRQDAEGNNISCALFAAIANDPGLLLPLQERYRRWQEKFASSAPTPELGTLIRLTLDGLWFSELAGLAPPAPAMRNKILDILQSMSKKDLSL